MTATIGTPLFDGATWKDCDRCGHVAPHLKLARGGGLAVVVCLTCHPECLDVVEGEGAALSDAERARRRWAGAQYSDGG